MFPFNMKQPFKKLTIAVTGNFGANRGHDQMKNWITRNGGKFTTEISSGVTHLICSKEQYKKDVLMGMKHHYDRAFYPKHRTQ